MIEYLNCCMLFLICAAEVNVLCEGSSRFSYKYNSYIYYCKINWLWVWSPLKEIKYLFYLYIFISSLWCRGKERRWFPPLNTKCLLNLAESGERSVLILNFLCLSFFYFKSDNSTDMWSRIHIRIIVLNFNFLNFLYINYKRKTNKLCLSIFLKCLFYK